LKKNVGDLDAFLRITAGLTFLGSGISRKSDFMILAGAMKVAEGITRFCPILNLLGKTTIKENNEDETGYIDII